MSKEPESKEAGTLLASLLAGLVRSVCRWSWPTLIISLLLCVFSVFLAWTQLRFLTQRNDLASPHKDYQQRWRQYVAEFGDDDDMVVVVQGRDRARMQTALEELAQRVQQQPKLFDRIFYKVDLRSLRDRALLFLPIEPLRQIQDNLRTMNLLLEPPLVAQFDPLFGWKSLTLAQLLSEGERRLPRAGEKNLRPADEQFLTQLAAITRVAADVLEDPQRYRSPWDSLLPNQTGQPDPLQQPQYFFSGDGSLAFLLVRPVKDTSSFTSAQQSIATLRTIMKQVEQGHPDLRFGLTGLPVLENDEMLASQQDTTLASWLALLGVGMLYLVVYRSLRSPLLTVFTLMVGTTWALGWATLTVGHLNILSATFAVMLIGLGDYGVLWVTRFEQERNSGADAETAMEQTARCVGPSILTAAATTALAFFATVLADFRAVAELGWIAGSGILLCALACFTVLPALMTIWPRREPAPSAVVPLPARSDWLPGLMHRPRWVLMGTAALSIVAVFFACRVQYDHNLLHLQAGDLESVQWEQTLMRHTSGASWQALSWTTTPEEALALKQRFEKLPCVSRVVEVASLIPREQERKLEVLRDIQHRLRLLPPRGSTIPHALPSAADLKVRVAAALAACPSCAASEQSSLVLQLAAHLQRLHQRLQHLDEKEASQRLQRFEDFLTRDLAEDLHRLREVSHPRPIQVADLPPSLRERYIGQNGKWLLRVFGKDCLWDYAPLENFVQQVQKIDPESTGNTFQTLEGLKAMQQGFLRAGVYALAAMVLVLLADFRNLRHTLLALTPLLLGLLLTLGLMGLLGLPLNPANMIGLPLILGVGVDNGVHIVHDYLSCRRLEGNRRYALSWATGRGIMVAALTTILGFGTLMISHHRGLAGLGLLLTLGVTCCMMMALVFLPALLTMLANRSTAVPQSETLQIHGKAA